MILFKKKPQSPEEQLAQSEELQKNQEILQDTYAEAKKSNQHILDLLERNHFHIKLYIAAGGVPRSKGVKK